MKHILTFVFAFMVLAASSASAGPLTLSDVGSVDTLVPGGQATLPNSGTDTEQNWIASVLGVTPGSITYEQVQGSGGSNWQPIQNSTTLFAFNLGSDPTWFLVKTGGGGATFDHFLFQNLDNTNYAVIDFSVLGFDDVNIQKISHVGIASGGDEGGSTGGQTAVPEPASLTLLGLGMSGVVRAIRRRRRNA